MVLVCIGVTLREHDVTFAERIFELVMEPAVNDQLGIKDQSPEDTKGFLFLMPSFTKGARKAAIHESARRS